jgi:hypothetical protein
LPIAGAVAIVTIVVAWGIHDGEKWGDDFAQYIAHARNITTGAPYEETGHLFGAGIFLGPRAYPPLYPLALAPIYWAAGVDFIAFKALNVAAIGGALWLWAQLLRPVLGPWLTAAWILLVGTHPLTREHVDHVLSDALFLFLASAALVAIERGTKQADARAAARRGVIIGALIAGAALTRFVGIVLIPIVPLLEWIRTRRISRVSPTVIATATLLIAASFVAVPGQLTYMDEPGPPFLERVVAWIQRYATDSLGFLPGVGEDGASGILAAVRMAAGLGPQWGWTGGAAPMGTVIVAIVMSIVAVAGVATRQAPAAMQWFAVFYVAAIVSHRGYAGTRVAWQLLPLVSLYFILGLRTLGERVASPRAAMAAAIAAVVFNVMSVPVRPYTYSILEPEVQQFFAFMRDSTPRDAIVVFAKPRALALFTGRRGFSSGGATGDELESLVWRSGATYLVATPVHPSAISAYATRNPGKYVRVYSAGGFEVFAAR